MAIHDYVIANQTGANTRSDLNNAFSAIVSNNSSATEPTTTYAYMWWADTGNDLLKQRNAANGAWVDILVLSTGAPSAGGGIASLAADTTPQLGGDLNVNGNSIVSASNADIAITPNGTGNVVVDGIKHPQADGTSGQYLKTDGAGQLSFGTVSSGGGYQSTQVFTSSGTWTKPSGINTVRVQLVGSGAGGRNSNISGGAGGYSEKTIDVSAISSVSVTVGASASSNSSGSSSSFGSHCSATGGSNPSGSGGGIGGVGSGGDINIGGGGGTNIYSQSSGRPPGASSYFGGGNAGAGTSAAAPINVTNGAYGSGGGATANGYSPLPASPSGVVIVYEFA
jgi:hypothetical protein